MIKRGEGYFQNSGGGGGVAKRGELKNSGGLDPG